MPYQQCHLIQNHECGVRNAYPFIDSRFAIPGKTVSVDAWRGVWTVVEVYGCSIDRPDTHAARKSLSSIWR